MFFSSLLMPSIIAAWRQNETTAGNERRERDRERAMTGPGYGAQWPFSPPITPMEAEVAGALPSPPGWGYEPKWDGFRVLMWSGAEPRLDSRNGKPLLRYFPELRAALDQLPAGTVADGELVVVTGGRLDFDALQNRIHPAESRVRRLAEETPARLALFDLLAVAGHDLRARPLRERRQLLEELAGLIGVQGGMAPGDDAQGGAAPAGVSQASSPWLLSPQTLDVQVARRWFDEFEPAGFDGIVAKGLERPYAEGRREMIKVKHRRTVDCVVGGYRLHKDGTRVGSILLGLYDQRGELHFIGHCSSFSERAARDLLTALLPLRPPAVDDGESGFGEHARRPGGPSRWSGDKDLEYEPVRPLMVVEVSYDQLTGDRFRHATRFERWRSDKDPRDCTMDQLERPAGPALMEMLGKAGGVGRPVRLA
jgi:ATP-dependent DNA ligase